MKQINNNDQKLNHNPVLLQDNSLSMYCYRDNIVKDTLLKIKNDQDFSKSNQTKTIADNLLHQIYQLQQVFDRECELIIVNIPSTSFWMSQKKFDHMHVFIKTMLKIHNSKDQGNRKIKIKHVPYAIRPRLIKKTQKVLSREQRINQSNNAYSLSLYFKWLIKKNDLNIIIIDDIHTTGATINSCLNTLKNFNTSKKIQIKCVTIAYEP